MEDRARSYVRIFSCFLRKATSAEPGLKQSQALFAQNGGTTSYVRLAMGWKEKVDE
jgi:hypothetical protein